MAKPEIKKSVVKKDPAPAAVAPTEKKTRKSGAVLTKVTATQLKDLIGADTAIGVSRKELHALVTKGAAAAALAAAGL